MALAVDDMVLVEPKDRLQQSFSPANFIKFRIFSPATIPNPLGPGINSIVTLPPRPWTLKGTE